MKNRTLIDIELAKIYFEILIDLAKSHKGQTVEYGRLIQLAKEKYPSNEFLHAAVPVNVGRRLEALREFTQEKNLPDLSALVVNKTTGDNGKGFTRSFDGDAVRAEIAAYDWEKVQVDFDLFIDRERLEAELRQQRAVKPKRIKEPEALGMWWDYYKDRKSSLAWVTPTHKEMIIQKIMDGQTIEQSLDECR